MQVAGDEGGYVRMEDFDGDRGGRDAGGRVLEEGVGR